MPPEVHRGFAEFVEQLLSARCDFVVVGAHALAAHGVARATNDLYIFVRPTRENAMRIFQALVAFGAPVAAHGVGPADFETPGTVYQMGLPPMRIDVLTQLTGVTFDEATAEAVLGHLGPHEVRCIGFEAMLKNKRAAGRPKDLGDVAALEELRARQQTR